MLQCVACGCNNQPCIAREDGQQEENEEESKVTFHRFPKDAARRAAWIQAVHKKNWSPTTNSVLCSDHFTEDCFDRISSFMVRMREYAVPSVFPAFPDHLKKKVERLKNQFEKDFILQCERESQKRQESLLANKQCHKKKTKQEVQSSNWMKYPEEPQIILQEMFPPNMCRICAEICRDVIPIFGDPVKEEELVMKIHTHLPIMVTAEDLLPVSICRDCLKKLDICHDLVTTCLNADLTLRQILNFPSKQMLKQETDGGPEQAPAGKEASREDGTEPTSGEAYSHETSDAQVVGGKACPQHREGDRLFPGTRRGVQLERQYVCPTCGKAFRDGSALHHHQDIHRDIKYTCKECGKVYGNRSGLYWHAWTHRNATFLCPVCGELVRKGSSVYTHKMKHARACHWCGEKFSDWKLLKAHLNSRHKFCPNKCTCCTKLPPDSDWKSDVLASPCEDQWKCEYCVLAFASRSALNIHLARKHRCHTCLQCFKNEFELNAHECTLRRKGNPRVKETRRRKVASAPAKQEMHKIFTCDWCGDVFFHIFRYCKHRGKCKSLQKWECQKCGKVSRDRYWFMVHKQLHGSRKPYRCRICSKRFRLVENSFFLSTLWLANVNKQ
ncbi:zinc finger protein 70-like isoform X2 [Bacillus rossius redtenbacheri]|uniref:zinc finger protein 70-like isoform X2 n=1 Tax=Bacillus rossius redtenbacheri TaxID=93214 RepID=UPI002FDD0762